MNQKAIVFNCHHNGLSIIQALGKNGISCIAMDCARSIGTYSKYATYIKCPDPSIQEQNFIEFLYEFCKNQDLKPVLFPTNDHWASAISKHKELLSEVSMPVVGDWQCVDLCLNKDIFYRIGMEKRYLTPKTWDLDEVLSYNESIYPLVIKPKFRRISSNTELKQLEFKKDKLRFNLINNISELHNFIKKNDDLLDHFIFQEYINGFSDSMYTVGIYANENSDVIGIFTGHKVRGYPADSGDCIVGESMEIPEYVSQNALDIVKDIGYNGIAEFEYKKDSVSGQFRLIEINPRSWSWIGITPDCGINLPLLAYYDLCGIKFDKTEFVQKQTHVKYVKLISDFINCIFLYKKTYSPWHMNFFEWKKSLHSEKTVYAEFSSSDILIALKAISDNFFSFLIYSLRKLR